MRGRGVWIGLVAVAAAVAGCSAGAPGTRTSAPPTSPAAGAGGGTAASPGTTPQQRAARAIGRAMTSRSVAAFDISARNTSDPAQFYGQGRIGMSSGGSTAAATHVGYDPGEDPWFPPDVVVIGDHAWVTPDNSPATGTDAYGPTAYVGDAAGAARNNLDVNNALQTRWLASPEHLTALVEHADHYRETGDAGRVITGQVPLATLASDPAGGFFYRPYAKASPGQELTFTLTTGPDHLPVSVQLTVPFHRTEPDYLSKFTSDPFSVKYRDWAKGAPITTPAPSPSPQWGGFPPQNNTATAQPST
ncbi:hypothetical protein WJM95_33635 [Streptomyces sp. f51]|uniref:hypothetical protein n=1 Tax=Streptomyces sp. f51 TaxID=1827742 RepID=UPI0030CA682D